MDFADRVTHLAPEGAYHMLARAQALEAAGRKVIHLEIGQPDVPTFKNIADAGVNAIRNGITRYTASAGMPSYFGAFFFRFARTATLRPIWCSCER